MPLVFVHLLHPFNYLSEEGVEEGFADSPGAEEIVEVAF